MTKRDTAALERTISYGATLGPDYMARAISAMIRASNSKVQRELLERARQLPGVTQSAEFII